MKNPLIKRIPKELRSDWHKYFVIVVFMVVMIGVISGMYVGHDSMLAAVYGGRETLNLEDGSFELNKKASAELLDAISTGKKADVRQYYIDKGFKEADKEVAKAIDPAYKEQYESAIKEAHDKVVEGVDKEWDEAIKKYDLDNPGFAPVKTVIYENFYRNESEEYGDGSEEATVRVFKSDSKVDKASFNEGRAPENEN
ncbi:MAG: hypothetical protein K5858_02275, partial [Lachnospiraceae bacterium]|nr:hypothetical protein [Lachnospiraceae bacterium]